MFFLVEFACVVCFDWGCVEHVFEGICVCFHSLWLKLFFSQQSFDKKDLVLAKRSLFLPKDPSL